MHFLPVTFSLVGLIIIIIIIIFIIIVDVNLIIIIIGAFEIFPASFLSAFTLLGLPAEIYTQVT